MKKTAFRTFSATQIDTIREHLITSMRVLKMLPLSYRDRPARVRVLWPDFNQGQGIGPATTRRAIGQKATPRQISEMEHWLDLIFLLDDDCRRIVVARACRIPWRRLEEIDGRSHMDAGQELNTPVKWGGMWRRFEDIPHIELITPSPPPSD